MFTEQEYNRIFSKVSVDHDTGCWNWTGYLSDGYGRIYWRKRRYKAHRLFYIWKFKKLPIWKDKSSKELDHTCNNRACVNPGHLKLVSNKVNVLRGKSPIATNASKTICVNGHNSLYKVGNRRRCREWRRLFDASEKRKIWVKSRRVS